MKPLKRRVGRITMDSENAVQTINLPRNYNYRKLICYVNGTVTVTGGTGAGAVHTRAAMRSIQRVELVANGRDTIWSAPPEAIYVMNTIDYGTTPPISNPSSVAAGSYSFSGIFVIDLALVRGVRPIDTLFPAAALSTFDLIVTWSDGDALFTGSTNYTSASLSTSTELIVESFEEIGPAPSGLAVNKIYEINNTITAANDNYQVRLATGNTYRGFLINTNVDNVDTDAMLDGVRLESGTQVFQSWLGNDELLQYNKLQYGLETQLTGWHMIDFLDSDGFLSEIVDARNLSSLDLIFNLALPSGTTRSLRIYPQEIILPST